jgi:pantothenate synthetase
VNEMLSGYDLIKTDYFEIADSETLQPVDTVISDKTVACIAAFVGKVRLIDNISL